MSTAHINTPHECPYELNSHLLSERRRDADKETANDHAVRIALLEQGMTSIKTQLQGINTNMSKLVWLVFSAVILAILKLVLAGN